MASLQRPAAHPRDRVASSGRKEVTECNTPAGHRITLSGSAVTRRKTATVVRGYASTAIKHGHQVFTVIHDALAGNAWIPPIPDLT